jgi:hypothetical protein
MVFALIAFESTILTSGISNNLVVIFQQPLRLRLLNYPIELIYRQPPAISDDGFDQL